jgi:hypothetical protein
MRRIIGSRPGCNRKPPIRMIKSAGDAWRMVPKAKLKHSVRSERRSCLSRKRNGIHVSWLYLGIVTMMQFRFPQPMTKINTQVGGWAHYWQGKDKISPVPFKVGDEPLETLAGRRLFIKVLRPKHHGLRLGLGHGYKRRGVGCQMNRVSIFMRRGCAVKNSNPKQLPGVIFTQPVPPVRKNLQPGGKIFKSQSQPAGLI